MILAALIAAISFNFIDACKVGEFFVEGKIKMKCNANGVEPVACLPNGKLDDIEVSPGKEYQSASFVFLCKQDGPLKMSYEVISCRLPDGQLLAIGAKADVPKKGRYSCVRNADNTVSRKVQGGCVFNGQLFIPGQKWTVGSSQVHCVNASGSFEGRASGCVIGNQIIELGHFTQKNNQRTTGYFKCQANSQDASKAELVEASAAEYFEWVQGNAGDEEEAAAGDSGSGYVHTTLAPPPPPPAPVIESDVLQSDQQQNQTESVVIKPIPEPIPEPPVADQCQDVHPICETLCAKSCRQDAEPIGLALTRGYTGKLSLGSNSALASASWNQGSHRPSRPSFQSSFRPPQKLPQPSSTFGNSGTVVGQSWGTSWVVQAPSQPSRPSKPVNTASVRPPPPKPAPQGGMCSNFVGVSQDLVAALCPKSCGTCASKQNLQSVANKWATTSCAARQPYFGHVNLDQPIGLALN